jgi:hypothetical protein
VLAGRAVSAVDSFVPVYVKLLQADRRAVEITCAYIAQELRLPIPVPYLLKVNRSVLPRGVPWPYGKDESAICFATREIELAKPLNKVRDASEVVDALLAKWTELPRVAVFDHLIANDDRHNGNIVVDPRESLFIIDHDHAMGGGARGLFSDPFPTTVKNELLEKLASRSPAQKNAVRGVIMETAAQAAIAIGKIPYEDLGIEVSLASQINAFLQARSAHLVPMVLQTIGLPDLLTPVPSGLRPSA